MRRHSTYNYAFDNPIFFIDPDGMAPQSSIDPRKLLRKARNTICKVQTTISDVKNVVTKSMDVVGRFVGIKVEPKAEAVVTLGGTNYFKLQQTVPNIGF